MKIVKRWRAVLRCRGWSNCEIRYLASKHIARERRIGTTVLRAVVEIDPYGYMWTNSPSDDKHK